MDDIQDVSTRTVGRKVTFQALVGSSNHSDCTHRRHTPLYWLLSTTRRLPWTHI